MQDVALLAAHVLAGKGSHGLDDKHRGQLMTITGIHTYKINIARANEPGRTLLNGQELAKAASEALKADMKFEDISEYTSSLPLLQ